jgi:uncharacterized membrane protein
VLVNSLVFALGNKVLRAGLTAPAVALSWLLGTSVLAAFGLSGYIFVCLYFLLGSAVTKVKLAEKQKEGIAEARSGQRGIVRSSLKPIGNTWSYLACRIGHWVPIRQPFIGSSSQ